jgi:hypothetical protein
LEDFAIEARRTNKGITECADDLAEEYQLQDGGQILKIYKRYFPDAMLMELAYKLDEGDEQWRQKRVECVGRINERLKRGDAWEDIWRDEHTHYLG